MQWDPAALTLSYPEMSFCCRDPWLWRGTLGIKAWPVFYGPCDLSYKLTLSQMQCFQEPSATYISYHHCPKHLTFSKNTSLWNFHSIWEHPLSQTEAFQYTSHSWMCSGLYRFGGLQNSYFLALKWNLCI